MGNNGDTVDGLKELAGVLRRWRDWNREDRDSSGLKTDGGTAIYAVPGNWPTHAAITEWIGVIERAVLEINKEAPTVSDEG